MLTTDHHIATCLRLTKAISTSRTLDDIYSAALDSLSSGLGVERASILLFDPDGVMRFKAWRGLSHTYRAAVEGHTPWRPDTPDAEAIWVSDVHAVADLAAYAPVFDAEGIAAMAFIPLVSLDRVIGKFMLYYAKPTAASADELALAGVIAAQVAFAVERTRAEAQARRSEARLRFALDAASMGTWDWDITTNTVTWSDNLARLHGLPDGTFDGTFESYQREIHPDDRHQVMASIGRALKGDDTHDVEYRLLAPDGTVRWCEGKGQVEFDEGRPVAMSGVCMMVTRRKEAELARLAAAEEASRLKDEFLATLSHELRTPLNAIVGWVQLLQGETLPPARAEQAIAAIGRNARLQAQLIEDILDVSRIITGKLDIERMPVSMSQLLDTVLAAMTPSAEAAGIRVQVDAAADLPLIEGDARRLQQVLNNVLSNALKFTPAGGSVRVRSGADDAGVHITIEDTGIGIAPEFLPSIFERFRQADSRTTRAHGGLGLGLAIARHFIEQHGGAIHAHSDGAGRGTSVVIHLPVSAAANAAGTLAVPGPRQRIGLDGLTVLVVDDDRDSREMTSALLEHRGATVTQADSARAALTLLDAHQVDVIVADIAMPDVDGCDFLRRLRALGDATPAVALTALARGEDRHAVLQAGYSGHIAKPFDADHLVKAVRELAAAAIAPAS